MRRLYADMSPGLGWNGREPETLEAATATQATPRTVSSFLVAGVTALAAIPRPLAFLVGGATPAHAPATATITGTDENDAAVVEIVYLSTNAAGQRVAGAVCSLTNWKTLTDVVYSAGLGTAATVAMGFGLIPGVADLRLIPIECWLEGFGDRQRPGMLSVIAINELVRGASSLVDSRLVGSFTVPFDLPPPTEGAEAARYLAIGRACNVRSTVFKGVEREAVMEGAEAQLQLLRSAQAGFGETPPDPSLTVGGIVLSAGPRTMVDSPDGTVNSGDF